MPMACLERINAILRRWNINLHDFLFCVVMLMMAFEGNVCTLDGLNEAGSGPDKRFLNSGLSAS